MRPVKSESGVLDDDTDDPRALWSLYLTRHFDPAKKIGVDTKADADNSKPSPSHYYLKSDRLNPERPKDRTAPVDYRNGTVHVRLEVFDKPAGSEPTTWSVCYIPYKGQAPSSLQAVGAVVSV